MPRTAVAPLALALALVAGGCPESPKAPAPVAAPDASQGGAAPAPKPAAPAPKPFDRASARTPWRLAKVGDFSVYREVAGKGMREVRYEVTKVDGDKLEFTRKDAGTGAEISGPHPVDLAEEEGRYKDPMTYDGLAQDDKGQPIQPSREKVAIGGKELEALVVKRAMPGMGSTELWLAEETVRPFQGQSVVKSIKDGKVQIELLDFGAAQ